MFDKNDIVITTQVNKINTLKELNTSLLNIKIYTLNEFNHLYYFNYDEKTIYYIMNKYNCIYEIAKIYLDNMNYIENKKYNNRKLSFLSALKDELEEKKLLYRNPLFLESIRYKNIIFFNVPKTKEIQLLEKSLSSISNVSYKYSEYNNYNHCIYELSDINKEVEFVSAKICDLISNGVPLSKIYLTNLRPEYNNVIKRIFSMYNIPLTINNKESIYTTSIVTKFLENYNSDLSITIDKISKNVTNESIQSIFNKIISIINKYTFIDNKIDCKEMIKYDLKNTILESSDIPDSIHEVDLKDTVFKEDDYVFLLGFNQGIIPIIHKDELYLNDKELNELSISMTIDKNSLEREITSSKIFSIKNLFITYPLSINGEELTISSLNDILNYNIEKIDEVPLLYSNKYNQIKLASYLDDYYKYGTTSKTLKELNSTYPNIPYNTYDNRFKGLNGTEVFDYLGNKLVLSYTSLDKYYKCPFSYYISKVLKLDIYEETFEQIVGDIFHSILEQYNSSQQSFDSLWNQVVNSYEYEYSIKEKFFLNKLKAELNFIIKTIEEQETYTELHEELHEEKIDTIIDTQHNISFTGIIDKVKYNKTENGTIAAIVDYKTGNPNLDLTTIPYGIGMQLPVYLYLAHNSNTLKNVKIAGFYLQKILNNEIVVDKKHTYEQLHKKNLQLQGYSNEDINILSQFDKTYADSQLIQGMKTTKGGDFYSYTKTLTEKEMNYLSSIAEEKIKEGAKLITQAEFEIAPKQIGVEEYGCKYCKFKDICFRTNKDIVTLKELTKSEVLGGE